MTNKSINTRLIDEVTKFLSKETIKDSSYKPSPKFRPSSLGSPCLRKIYYTYLRVEPDIVTPLFVKRYGLKGNFIHELLGEVFREQGILIDYRDKDGNFRKDFFNPKKYDYEFPVIDKDLEVVAKIDGVLNIDGKIWLGEWKTATVKSFEKLKIPKPEHKVQAISYVYLFRKALKEGKFSHIPELDGITDIEGVKILYVNADDLRMKEFTITDGNDIFTQTVSKILTVKNHCKNNTLPPKTPDWCDSCPWQKKCVQNYKVEIE